MIKIRDAFDHGKAFVAFITCGDPDLETTAAVVRSAVKNGADLIELGIPFSDPTAEGPVIQGANLRALSGGVTTDQIFDLVRVLRNDVTVPMVFMTYANVVYSYGAEIFISTCQKIGIQGLILPDLPYEEKEEFLDLCHRYEVDLISLIAPTSDDRIAMIAEEAEGFVYLVSSMGVTGTRAEIQTDLTSIVETIREHTKIPCAIGFSLRWRHSRICHYQDHRTVWKGCSRSGRRVRKKNERCHSGSVMMKAFGSLPKAFITLT